MNATTLAVEWTPIDRLFNSPSNPRHNNAAVPHVLASLKRFGWQQPLVAKRSGEAIAGNTRLKATHELGAQGAGPGFDGYRLEPRELYYPRRAGDAETQRGSPGATGETHAGRRAL